MKPLTEKQAKIFEYIKGFIKRYKYAPTHREIMDACGYEYQASVRTIIDALVLKKYLKKTDDKIRNIEISYKKNYMVYKTNH